METQVIRGRFNLVTTTNADDVRLSINMNGIPAYLANQSIHAIIKSYTGTIVLAHDDDGVGVQTLNVCKAYDGLYERRKLVWVKLWLRPYYKSFNANPTVGSLTGGTGVLLENYGTLVPPSVYMLSDNNGANVNFTTINVSQMMANITGIRRKSATRNIKIFRRGLKMALAPKYTPIAHDPTANDNVNSHPGGVWNNTTATSAAQTGSDHFILVSDPFQSPNTNMPIYDVMFEMKYMWYDARTINAA